MFAWSITLPFSQALSDFRLQWKATRRSEPWDCGSSQKTILSETKNRLIVEKVNRIVRRWRKMSWDFYKTLNGIRWFPMDLQRFFILTWPAPSAKSFDKTRNEILLNWSCNLRGENFLWFEDNSREAINLGWWFVCGGLKGFGQLLRLVMAMELLEDYLRELGRNFDGNCGENQQKKTAKIVNKYFFI